MNRSSSNSERYLVFISCHAHTGGEEALSTLRGLFKLGAVPHFIVYNACNTTGVPEPSRQPMHAIFDRLYEKIALIGAGVGKTRMLPSLADKHAFADQGGRREALFSALASPGGTISDPDHFEWGRLGLFMSYESWSDSSWEGFIERTREQCSRQAGAEERALFSWTRPSCEGFLLNRLLSYPQSELLKFGEGVHGLGGLPSAFQLAWELIYRKMSTKARLGIAVPFVPDDHDASVLAWATTLAHWHGCEIMDDDEPDLKGCLVETRNRLAIHLSSCLDARTRRFVLLHELAHHILRHTPNTEYGLDPAALAPDLLWGFKRQERTADALASIWSYLLEGLDTIVREIVWRGKASLPTQSQLGLPLESRATPRSVKRSDAHCGNP